MVDYDFHQLNDKEFEVLCTDLLSAHFGLHIERYKQGKDGGIDGRFFSNKENTVIIQCKHYLKSGINALISKIKIEEKTKVDKLSPSRYILTTSIPLLPSDKKKILTALHPHIKTEADIFGQEDLNSILTLNDYILKKNYKLWFHGSIILEKILNNDAHQNNTHKIKEISDNNKKYVITKNHELAKELLEKNHTIIIKGAPGIGKTTLAEQLCYEYLSDGYELCTIEEKIVEGDIQFNPKIKQIFYFDDFLGDVIFDTRNNNNSSRITRFIKRILHSDNKKFILTSRSNILNEARNSISAFTNENIDLHEFEIDIQSLNNIDKAKILYNNIWHNNIDESFKEKIYTDKNYLKIIHHKNYNPRIISFITDSYKIKTIFEKDYWNYIVATLNNPKDVWHNVFQIQLDEISRTLIIAIAINENAIGYKGISEEEIKNIFHKISDSTTTFNDITKKLTGALLNRSIKSNKEVEFTLFDPSIRDYILFNYKNEFGLLSKIINIDKKTETLKNIRYYLYNSKIKDYYKLLNVISSSINIEKLEDQNFNCHVINELCDVGSIENHEKHLLKGLFKILSKKEIEELNKYTIRTITTYLNKFNTKESQIFTIEKILSWIEKNKDNLEILSLISELVYELEPYGGLISKRLSDYYYQHLIENIDEILDKTSAKAIRSDEHLIDDDEIITEIDDILSNLKSDHEISASDVIIYCNIDNFVDESYFYEDEIYEKDSDTDDKPINENLEIDELFNRD